MRCKNCILEDSTEGIRINKKRGVCNFCTSYDLKWKDNKEDEKDFQEQISQIKNFYKGKCVLPLSGGFDSTYTAYYAVKKLHLDPEVVTFDNMFQTKFARENISNLVKNLGLRHHNLSIDTTLQKDIYRIMLNKTGEICTACNHLIYYSIFKFAKENNLPFIITGISGKSDQSTIYNGIRYCREELFNRILQDDISKKQIQDLSIKALCNDFEYILINLPDYIPWNVKAMTQELIEEGIINHEYLNQNLKHRDCVIADFSNYVRYKRSGVIKDAFHTAFLVRDNQLSKKEAEKRERNQDVPQYPKTAISAINKKLELEDNMNQWIQNSRWKYVCGKRSVADISKIFRNKTKNVKDLKGKIDILINLINEELSEDGGHIIFDSLNNNYLKLKTEGYCDKCVLKHVTLTSFVEGLFLRLIPDDIFAVKLV